MPARRSLTDDELLAAPGVQFGSWTFTRRTALVDVSRDGKGVESLGPSQVAT
jgi:hypothetical protein